jgi:CheY-like chemotaxis protein
MDLGRINGSRSPGTPDAESTLMAIVLVVNDDRDMLEVYQELLSEMGHRAVPRLDLDPDPEEVLRARADALVIDLQTDAHPAAGLEVIEALRKHPATRTIPIVLSTGAANEVKPLQPRLASLEVPVLIKPFGTDEFKEVVERILPA